MENRRKHIRVSYDNAYSLDFMMGGNEHKTVDLSEKGIKYRPSMDSIIEIGQKVEGKIKMNSAIRPNYLSGNVVRIDGKEIAVIFDKELQLPRINLIREFHYALKARSN